MRTGPDLATVMTVLQRDGYHCVRCNAPIQGDRGVGWVLHHRRPRAMGGTRRDDANSPANLLSLCAPCHDWIESNRNESRAAGWLVPLMWDPATVPVVVAQGTRRVHLDAEGGYVDVPAEVTA